MFSGLFLVVITSCSTHYPSVPSSSGIESKGTPAVDTRQRVYSSSAVDRQAQHEPEMQSRQAMVKESTRPRSDSQPHYKPNDQPQSAEPKAYIESKMTPSVMSEQQMPLPAVQQPTHVTVINIAEKNAILFKASETGDTALIYRSIEQGANVLSANTNGETALHSAAAHNQLEAAKILIEKGADVNSKTISGWTPLHSAARFGSVDVIRVLTRAGSSVNTRNSDGKLPRDLAIQAGHQSAVIALYAR